MNATMKPGGAGNVRKQPMMKPWVTWCLILCVIVLLVIPFVVAGKGKFVGSDDQGSDMIEQLRPGYQPWFHSLWTPPSDEIESFLFCVQTGIGVGVIAYVFGNKRGQVQGRRAAEAARGKADKPS